MNSVDILLPNLINFESFSKINFIQKWLLTSLKDEWLNIELIAMPLDVQDFNKVEYW